MVQAPKPKRKVLYCSFFQTCSKQPYYVHESLHTTDSCKCHVPLLIVPSNARLPQFSFNCSAIRRQVLTFIRHERCLHSPSSSATCSCPVLTIAVRFLTIFDTKSECDSFLIIAVPSVCWAVPHFPSGSNDVIHTINPAHQNLLAMTEHTQIRSSVPVPFFNNACHWLRSLRTIDFMYP